MTICPVQVEMELLSLTKFVMEFRIAMEDGMKKIVKIILAPMVIQSVLTINRVHGNL